MAVCLDYQAVCVGRNHKRTVSWQLQLAAFVLLLCVVIMKLRTRLQVTSYGYELHQEQQRTLDLERRIGDLEYQFSVLTKHGQIREESKERLHMDNIRRNQVVRIPALQGE